LALIVYSAVCAGFYVWQDRLVFKPERHLQATPANTGLAYEDLKIRSPDGTSLAAWYVPGRPGGQQVLLLHGNGGNISHYLRTLAVLHQLGHSVLALDYRGYGASGGTPSEAGAYQDAAAAFDYLVEARKVAPASIVIYGRSLGGAVASWLAAHRPAGALVLESTFTRLADVASYRYPWLPVHLLSRNVFDSVTQLAQVHCPILVAHGSADSTVPPTFGRELAHAAGAKAEFVALPGGHNDAFIQGGSTYYRHLDQFMRRAVID
jgi:pimeloyl-ACP methyl ester carboxylesterase